MRCLVPSLLLLTLTAPPALAESLTLSSTTTDRSACQNQSKVTASYTAASKSSDITPRLQLFATEADCPTPSSGATSVEVPDGGLELFSSRDLRGCEGLGEWCRRSGP